MYDEYTTSHNRLFMLKYQQLKKTKTRHNKVPRVKSIIYFLLFLVTLGCSKDDTAPLKKESVKSAEKELTSFKFLVADNTDLSTDVEASIDITNNTITATLPINTLLTALTPTLTISTKAAVNPAGTQDFTNPVIYTVTAEDGTTNNYTVVLEVALTQRQILQKILDLNPANTLNWDLQNITDLGTLIGVTTNAEGRIVNLELESTALEQLPEEIGQLNSLEEMYLGQNQITAIPDEIGQLTNLVNFDLSMNKLESLPAAIGQMANLRALGLGGNLLKILPAQIGDLSNLNVLDLKGNQLETIPLDFASLTKLRLLNISSNNLDLLPSVIVQLTSLTDLNLGSNKLTSLPVEIGNLTNLILFTVSDNMLTELPLEIAKSTDLQYLRLSENKLASLPIEIGLLTKLQDLYISDNELNTIPPEIGFLTKLITLDLRNNNVISIPRSICQLRDHNELNLLMDVSVTCGLPTQKDALISIYSANPDNTLTWGVNNFPEVDFDVEGNPTGLRISNKNVTRLPDFIGVLTSLEILLANNNFIASIPKSLGSINGLVVLEVGNNLLNTLPAELGQLENLELLNLTNNPITGLPQEVCNLQPSNGGLLNIIADAGEGCD